MGVRFAIATGRPRDLIGDVTEQIPFTDYVISANGASVFDRNSGREIYSCLIHNSIACDLIAYFLGQNVFFDVYVDGRSKYQLGCEKYFADSEFPDDFVENVKKSMDGYADLVQYLDGRGVEKITLYSISNDKQAIYREVLERAGLSVTSSFDSSLEATDKNADKGIAAAQLGEKLGLTADEIMCFGDAGNDVPMLKFAGYSFAMGNATEECKKSAKFMAKSNAEDGLAEAVEKYVINCY